jgi:hypothetical protein
MCAINWPNKSAFDTCPVCDESTDFISNANPSADWQERQEEGTALPTAGHDSAVGDYRFERFRGLGLDIITAMSLASNRDVDIHEFERLLSRGCDLDTAAAIVR